MKWLRIVGTAWFFPWVQKWFWFERPKLSQQDLWQPTSCFTDLDRARLICNSFTYEMSVVTKVAYVTWIAFCSAGGSWTIRRSRTRRGAVVLLPYGWGGWVQLYVLFTLSSSCSGLRVSNLVFFGLCCLSVHHLAICSWPLAFQGDWLWSHPPHLIGWV